MQAGSELSVGLGCWLGFALVADLRQGITPEESEQGGWSTHALLAKKMTTNRALPAVGGREWFVAAMACEGSREVAHLGMQPNEWS